MNCEHKCFEVIDFAVQTAKCKECGYETHVSNIPLLAVIARLHNKIK